MVKVIPVKIQKVKIHISGSRVNLSKDSDLSSVFFRLNINKDYFIKSLICFHLNGKMNKVLIITGFFVSFVVQGQLLVGKRDVKPFPQHTTYTTGVIKPGHVSQVQLDDSVRSFYSKWKERYIKDDAGEGQYYIWFEGGGKKKKCVSEGQGYGMIVVALMAGYDANAQKFYDGLFHYYKSHPSKNSPFLMTWAQTAAFKDVDRSSAADGDLDIAYSLVLADAQWGSHGEVNYIEEARAMISAIMKQEINPKTFSVLLSNTIDKDSRDYFDMRSSDFMPAHFKIFRNVSKDSIWDKVVD